MLLRRPSVNFEFVDPELENRSAGQKMLIRMGSENAAVVKAKLRELRKAVAKQERPLADTLPSRFSVHH